MENKNNGTIAANYGDPSIGVGIIANNKCDKINSNDVNIIHLLLYPTLW